MERHSFRIVSGDSPKIMRKLCHSTKFPHQQIRSNYGILLSFILDPHCVKSARIRSYSGSHFPTFGLNTERYSVSLRIQSEWGKMWTRITPNTDTFPAVGVSFWRPAKLLKQRLRHRYFFVSF